MCNNSYKQLIKNFVNIWAFVNFEEKIDFSYKTLFLITTYKWGKEKFVKNNIL